jgi:hypothetical protein
MYFGRPIPRGFHLLAHGSSQVSGLESDGLWFIAVGALLIVVAVLLGGHPGGLGSRPLGRQGTPRDRLVYAWTAAGACLVAVGSVIVAVKAFPALWVVAVTVVGAALAVWLFAAWRLRVDSRNGRDDAQHGLDDYPNLRSVPGFVEESEWNIKRYERQMTWRWYLTNPFRSEASARADAEAHLGPRPSRPQPPQPEPPKREQPEP